VVEARVSWLKGKVALVTGASRGIGREIALALAREGADCVVTATTAEGAAPTAKEISALSRRALPLACDLARPEQIDRIVECAEREFARIDVVVNNAAIIHRAPLMELTDADIQRVLAVNLLGPMYLCRRVVPPMLSRREGRVINLSSISGTLACPRALAYAASKWGLDGFTRSLAEEVKGKGVFVAAVLPGSVDTTMLEGSGFQPAMSAAEVAGVVRYLCAEAPMAMSGSLVEVFG
jgi:3-oxoacyl-[acyl-carrier protein] reductase